MWVAREPPDLELLHFGFPFQPGKDLPKGNLVFGHFMQQPIITQYTVTMSIICRFSDCTFALAAAALFIFVYTVNTDSAARSKICKWPKWGQNMARNGQI